LSYAAYKQTDKQTNKQADLNVLPTPMRCILTFEYINNKAILRVITEAMLLKFKVAKTEEKTVKFND